MSEQFQAIIRPTSRGGAFVEVPAEVDFALGGAGRIQVQASFDGHPYRGSIVTMSGTRLLPLLKSIREAIGKGPGDGVTVIVAVDDAPRTVDVPAELTAALVGQNGARNFFEGLSYTCRREYAQWVGGAKKPETRERRAAKALEMLSEGKRL